MRPTAIAFAMVLAHGAGRGEAVAAQTVYTSEADFLAAVDGIAGAWIAVEGFEEEPPWDAVRTTIEAGAQGAAAIVHGDITWTSNNATSAITTSMGAAHTGLWGVFSYPHGDQTVDEEAFIADGFRAHAAGTLLAAGVWVRGTTGSNVIAILDDGAPVSLGAVDGTERFYGVIDDAGFSTFELQETEGTLGDQKYIFGDDVILVGRDGNADDGGPTDGGFTDDGGLTDGGFADGGGLMDGADLADGGPSDDGSGEGDPLGGGGDPGPGPDGGHAVAPGEPRGDAGPGPDDPDAGAGEPTGGCAAVHPSLPILLVAAFLRWRRRP